jgi:four helix bundle protein
VFFMQDYRKLRVWGAAHALAIGVRQATNGFPRTGYASLRSQVTTAAESIAFNIVEGCGAAGQAEFARFLDISRKSSMELEYQLRLARDYGILPRAAWESLSENTIDVRRMICGLRKKVLAAAQ